MVNLFVGDIMIGKKTLNAQCDIYVATKLLAFDSTHTIHMHTILRVIMISVSFAQSPQMKSKILLREISIDWILWICMFTCIDLNLFFSFEWWGTLISFSHFGSISLFLFSLFTSSSCTHKGCIQMNFRHFFFAKVNPIISSGCKHLDFMPGWRHFSFKCDSCWVYGSDSEIANVCVTSNPNVVHLQSAEANHATRDANWVLPKNYSEQFWVKMPCRPTW